MPKVEERSIELRGGHLKPKVLVAGRGRPVVFLHGEMGLRWDPFLESLASSAKVYAPFHPGLSDPGDIGKIDTLWDMVLYHLDLLDALGLKAPTLVGHSYGGLLAAEVAATNPERVGKLVLLSPLGFWLDDHPVKDWVATTSEELAKASFYDANGEAARFLAQAPQEEAAKQDHTIAKVWTLACTSKFIWPIPDKGLKRRIYRIKAPTLILWGENDAIVDPVYAKQFVDGMVNTSVRVESVRKAGHYPHLEQQEQVVGLIQEFVRS